MTQLVHHNKSIEEAVRVLAEQGVPPEEMNFSVRADFKRPPGNIVKIVGDQVVVVVYEDDKVDATKGGGMTGETLVCGTHAFQLHNYPPAEPPKPTTHSPKYPGDGNRQQRRAAAKNRKLDGKRKRQ
jgi:hypothetical protein